MTTSDVVATASDRRTKGGTVQMRQDRRFFKRYAIAVPAEISVGETRFECAITNLSLGGAAIFPGHTAWEGQEIRLHSPDFGFEKGVRGRVVRASHESAHIAFDLDEDMEGALTMFLVMSLATR